MDSQPDVLVAGGGPAGATAAIHAARAGMRVILVDKASFPRDKTCGDGLTAMALRALEHLDVDVPALPGYQRVDTTVLVTPNGRRITLPHAEDGHHAGVVRREALDAALLARARDAGVDVRERVAVAEVAPDGSRLKVGLSDGTWLATPFVVAADGHWSTVRRLVEHEASPDLGEWHAVRQYFEHVDDDRLFVLFERDLLPGYAWVFPLPNGGANVGYGVLRRGRAGRDLRALWPSVRDRRSVRRVLGPRAQPAGPMRAWPIPTRFDASRLAAGRVLFAGDAARVVDPMTGEGIAQAMESGALAAESISLGGDAGDVTTRYRTSVERALGADLRFAAALQRVLGTATGARLALAAIGTSAWTRRNVARWMWEDYPRALLLTPRRWRHGMLRPPGAFATAAGRVG
jgi:geranylgeranyl reductase family protein